MLDQIESMECAAENHLFEMTRGLPEGKFKCDCGEIGDLSGAMSASVNPYSYPVCGKCEEAILYATPAPAVTGKEGKT